MSGANPFSSAKRRLARAKKHIRTIERQCKAFFGKKPYAHIIEADPQTRFEFHKIRLTKPLPDTVTDLAYEAIEGMRASLDHAAHAVASRSSVRPKDLERLHFPIADDAAKFEDLLKQKGTRDLPSDILALFRSFKPYKGDNFLIWALNQVRRQGTHRLIVPVGLAVPQIHVHHMTARSPGPVDLMAPQWDAEKHEIVFARTIPGAQLEYNLNLSFFVAFGEVEGLKGEPAIGALDDIAGEVERIIVATEAKAREIGLI
jgi:hypothetical protein